MQLVFVRLHCFVQTTLLICTDYIGLYTLHWFVHTVLICRDYTDLYRLHVHWFVHTKPVCADYIGLYTLNRFVQTSLVCTDCIGVCRIHLYSHVCTSRNLSKRSDCSSMYLVYYASIKRLGLYNKTTVQRK